MRKSGKIDYQLISKFCQKFALWRGKTSAVLEIGAEAY